jgi:hypothetical protein
MSYNMSGIPGWKKILIATLIVADIALLVVGAITIPPHFRKTAVTAKQTKNIVPAAYPDADDAPNPVENKSPTRSTDLSTDKRPNLEDFLWYTEGVFYDSVPAEAVNIEELGTVTGSWKALIIYDPDNTYDSSAMEFLNLSISGTADSVSLTLDWYQIFWSGEGESYDETEMEDSIFTGKWENSGLWASGTGTIRLTDFYAQNGKQYAIGTMDTPDGIPAYIALVRP